MKKLIIKEDERQLGKEGGGGQKIKDEIKERRRGAGKMNKGISKQVPNTGNKEGKDKIEKGMIGQRNGGRKYKEKITRERKPSGI